VFVSQPQEVDTVYFYEVTTAIQSGSLSVTGLTVLAEEE
jgi:hypothetical protein